MTARSVTSPSLPRRRQADRRTDTGPAGTQGHRLPEAQAGPGRELDGATRAAMEARFGRSFADVRIHADGRADAMAKALGADAFTQGRSIAFAAGRYDTRSPEGQRLLAHELAHVAHGAEAAERRPGIAPETSRAEILAERAAAGDRRVLGGLRDWGPAWDVHRQVTKISKTGAVKHTGEIGRRPGETGVPYGTIEVRTGEEIEFKGGGKLPNVISLAYTGIFTADTHWLQYVWFEMTAATPAGTARLSGSVPTTSGTKPFTTDPSAPHWSIDSGSSSNPFYAATGAHLRDSSSITIFDAPGGASVAPLADAVFGAGVGATSATFTAHFETYLVQSDRTQYRVTYSASTAFSQDKAGKAVAGAIGYSVGASGQVAGLPPARKTMLDSNFPAFKKVQ